jgi:hypothetical protein
MLEAGFVDTLGSLPRAMVTTAGGAILLTLGRVMWGGA